jgi:hypothetical protein
MSIAVTWTYGLSLNSAFGTWPRKATGLVTGLTAGAINVVPHGFTSPPAGGSGATSQACTPVRVDVNGWGASSETAPILDSTNNGAGTGLAGFDSTNIYLNVPSGCTTCELIADL